MFDEEYIPEGVFTPYIPAEYKDWVCGCQNEYQCSSCKKPLEEDNWSIAIRMHEGYGEVHLRHCCCPKDQANINDHEHTK